MEKTKNQNAIDSLFVTAASLLVALIASHLILQGNKALPVLVAELATSCIGAAFLSTLIILISGGNYALLVRLTLISQNILETGGEIGYFRLSGKRIALITNNLSSQSSLL